MIRLLPSSSSGLINEPISRLASIWSGTNWKQDWIAIVQLQTYICRYIWNVSTTFVCGEFVCGSDLCFRKSKSKVATQFALTVKWMFPHIRIALRAVDFDCSRVTVRANALSERLAEISWTKHIFIRRISSTPKSICIKLVKNQLKSNESTTMECKSTTRLCSVKCT